MRAAGATGSVSEGYDPPRALSNHRLGRMHCGIPNEQTVLARLLDIPLRSLVRYIAEGGIPLYTADRFAARLGKHPFEVWGQEFYADLETA